MDATSDPVFEYSPDGLIYLDEASVIRRINPAARNLLGIGLAEAEGALFWHCFPEAQTQKAEHSLSEILVRKRPLRFELFFPRRYIWASVLGVPDGDGTILFVRDVSDRVRSMHTEAVQEGVRAIIEVAPVAISITHGKQHRTTMMNAKARELIGEREVVGLPARKAFPELEGQGLFEVLDDVWNTGLPYVGKTIPVKYVPGGSTELQQAYFDVTYQPLLDTSGVIYGIMSVSVDVTSQVEAKSAAGPAS